MADDKLAARLWRELCALNDELKKEAKNCTNGMTEHYRNLKNDMAKLKRDYEKAAGAGTYDPTNVGHGERMTRQKVLGDRMGYTGPETNHGLKG